MVVLTFLFKLIFVYNLILLHETNNVFVVSAPDPEIVTTQKTVGKHLYLIPKIGSEWKPASIRDLVCPPLVYAPDVLNWEIVPFQIGSLKHHHELDLVDGYLCSGLKYKVSCSENFFGTKTTKRTINHFKPSISECKDDYEKIKSGSYIEPYFPSPECNWMQDNDVVLNFRSIVVHKVSFDPYKEGLVNPIFLKDYCNATYCETVHENTLWLSNVDLNSECEKPSYHNGFIYISPDKKKQILEYDVNQYSVLTDGCLITYCGNRGVRLSNGLFKTNVITGSVSNLRECKAEEKISFVSLSSKIDLLEEQIELNKERTECFDHLKMMESNRKPSFYSMSFLEPRTMGKHLAFRINNGTIEKALREWLPIQRFNFTETNQIGSDQSNKPVYWDDWVFSGIEDLYSGFNGVYKIKSTNKIVIPRIEIIQRDYEESMLWEHELTVIEHPIIKHLKKEGLDGDEVELIDKNTVDVGRWISSVWKTFWGKVSTIITSIIILVILILFCCYCLPCIKPCFTRCCKSNKAKKNLRENYELQTLNEDINRLTRPMITEDKRSSVVRQSKPVHSFLV